MGLGCKPPQTRPDNRKQKIEVRDCQGRSFSLKGVVLHFPRGEEPFTRAICQLEIGSQGDLWSHLIRNFPRHVSREARLQ